MEPASIRYKNPGAMWGGNAISKKWGEQGNVSLNDGLGQGNRIAVFPDYVHGICAQIDLWRSPRYRNKSFREAIAVWSGGNWVDSYVKFVTSRVPAMTASTIINDAFLNSPTGIEFLKAQAWHEAGKPYPAPDADWIMAQKIVFGSAKLTPQPGTIATSKVAKAKKSAGAVAAGGAAATVAHQSGLSPVWVCAIGLAAAAAFFIVWKARK